MSFSPIPCHTCGRQRYHSPDCRLQALHSAVDEAVASHGIEAVQTSILSAGSEKQKSVSEWSHSIFGHLFTDIRQRAIASLEENVEVSLAAGLTPEEIRAVVEVPIRKMEASGDRGDLALELADEQICLWAFAEMAGVDVLEQVNRKMAVNRSRPKSYYDEKLKQKALLGMPYRDNKQGSAKEA